MGKNGAANGDVVLAAGGIIWRDDRGREVAVIHRPGRSDWTFPKGKLDPGERWQEAAVREVLEETGLVVVLGEFAGSCSYMTRTAPKIVLYWHMRLKGDGRFEPHDAREVDIGEWLSIEAALARLTYDRERRLLLEATSEI